MHVLRVRNTNRCSVQNFLCVQNLKQERKMFFFFKVKDKQQTAEADSVIVWIGDRLLEY